MSTEHLHFLLNKPYGYISQFISNQPRAHKKRYLSELFNFPDGTMAVGRLDEASEGLLLLTTDGKLSETIRSHSVSKEYWAQLDGMIDDSALSQLESNLLLKGDKQSYLSKSSVAKRINEPEFLQSRAKSIRDDRHGPTSWISLTIREGKFRQVRRMTAKVGFPTLRLIRTRIGGLKLNQMRAGECHTLNQSGLNMLLNEEKFR